MDASKSFPAPLLNPWYEELRRFKKKKKKSTEQPPHEGSEGSKRLLPELERKPGGGLVVGGGEGARPLQCGLVTLCAVLAKLSASKSKAVMSLL